MVLRVFSLALLLCSSCATTRAVTSAGQGVATLTANVNGVAESIRAIAVNIERHVEDVPQYEPEGIARPTSPLDAIINATVTVTPDLLAIYRAAATAWKQIRAMREKAEPAP